MKDAYTALVADEATHIFYNAEDGKVDFTAEINLFAHIEQRNFLNIELITNGYRNEEGVPVGW